LHSLSFLLALQTTDELICGCVTLPAPSPQFTKLHMFTIKLYVGIFFRLEMAVQLWQTIPVRFPFASNLPSAHENLQDHTSCHLLVSVLGATIFFFGVVLVLFLFFVMSPPPPMTLGC
jgi:hypothetical protein